MSPIHNGEHDDMRIGDTLERRAELGCFVLTRDDKSRGYSKHAPSPFHVLFEKARFGITAGVWIMKSGISFMVVATASVFADTEIRNVRFPLSETPFTLDQHKNATMQVIHGYLIRTLTYLYRLHASTRQVELTVSSNEPEKWITLDCSEIGWEYDDWTFRLSWPGSVSRHIAPGRYGKADRKDSHRPFSTLLSDHHWSVKQSSISPVVHFHLNSPTPSFTLGMIPE